MVNICWIAIDELTPNGRNARTHSRKQIREIADSIAAFGFVVPILIDDDGVMIAGHGRYAAAKLLGLKQVPAIKVRGKDVGRSRIHRLGASFEHGAEGSVIVANELRKPVPGAGRSYE